MITKIYIMSNDLKWMQRVEDLDITPYVGMDLTGLVPEQTPRISGSSYDVGEKSFKLRLAWLTQDPLNADEMKENGWSIKT